MQIDEGKISGFMWDEGCVGCEELDTCKTIDLAWEDATAKTAKFQTCSKTDCTKEEPSCTLKVFVYWAGTDAKGKYMESGGYRLSNFKRQNADDIWKSMMAVTGA